MKPSKNPGVDTYLMQGCMRCAYGGTPQCKVHRWTAELELLRQIVLDCGLTEEVKWGVPCYTVSGKNVAMVSAFKDYASLSFFKGVLLSDPAKLLTSAGENSQSARLIKFTNTDQISLNAKAIKALVLEATANEQAGKKVVFEKTPEPVPEELQAALDSDPSLRKAFFALTPGRQRSYILHVSQPKQSATRSARVVKCIPKIMQGKGFHDR